VTPEAPLERVANGVRPAGPGWFVLNAREVPWFETDGCGFYATFEPENARFDQVGVGIGILRPGEPSSMYHGEDAQEDFLVLSGECVLLVEGEERPLRAWDFVHCPPWTEHIFVGAGDRPCLVLAVGARRKGRGIRFPVSELALAYGAGVETGTTDSREAYARASAFSSSGCASIDPGSRPTRPCPRSAVASTTCRWRSSSRPPARRCCRRTRSSCGSGSDCRS
jgi:uncharacterized cupin superfamily protein